jgi:ribosome recycling factor
MPAYSKSDLDRRMHGALDVFKHDLAGLRTGRASTALLDPIQVEVYGANMPLNQVATVSVPEPRLLSVQVWDRSNIGPVEKAIRNAGLGINPIVDGQVIRLPIPDLTEERRKELAKLAGQYAEKARVAVRNVRRDGMDALKTDEKKHEISEDERKRREIEVQKLTDDAIAEIDAQYASESPRGTTPRWWEDVDEGDEIGPLVKGPLTVTDMICWHVGMGMGLYGVKPLRLGWKNRQRIPRFYQRDELGVPDVMQRVHWDPAYARRAGNPTTFDYGRMRETWLIHLCTDWMGDDAWLWRLDCEFRKFNWVGDTHWMRGRVVRKHLADGGRPAVDLDIWGENQRGEVTTPGHATVLLPSREHGAVQLPDPPGRASDLQSALEAIAERFARE